MRIFKKYVFYLFFVLIQVPAWSQGTFRVNGKVTNPGGLPMEFVNISVKGTSRGTSSDAQGNFQLALPPGDSILLHFTYLGFLPVDRVVSGKEGENKTIIIILEPRNNKLEEIEVSGRGETEAGFLKLEMKHAKIMPTVSGNIESYLKTLPGVTSNNELSSQYSVRGGNFDENLVYINDIEVYRPFLIRSGKQEGLSIVNSDLASSVRFSAGGFDASYGDKMSSVLDITYKKPEKFGGGFNLSLLGGSVYLQGLSSNKKLTWLAGARYKTNRYLLNTLDTRGDYKPSFGDFQTYLSYRVNKNWNIDFLGNTSLNQYYFVPEDRQTSFGTLVNAVQLYILFDGQEKDKDRKSTRLNSSHTDISRMPSSA